MPLSRRSFLAALEPEVSPFSSAAVASRGREAEQAAASGKKGAAVAAPPAPPPVDPNALRLDSNENPLGPGPNAMAAMTKGFDYAGRYPTNAKPNTSDLRDTIARKFGVRPENVLVGNGSGELLRIATRVYTSPARALVTASPSFESPVADGRAGRESGEEVCGRQGWQARPREDGRGRTLVRPGFLLQSEQPHRHRPLVQGGRRLRWAGAPGVPRDGDSDRRGVSRLRRRSQLQQRYGAGPRAPQRLRHAHPLEGLRHGGDAR